MASGANDSNMMFYQSHRGTYSDYDFEYVLLTFNYSSSVVLPENCQIKTTMLRMIA